MGSNNEVPGFPKSWESLKKLVDILQKEDVNEIPENPSIIKENTREIETMDKHESLKKDIESGRVKNYYINKEGDIIQKVTVHLPIDMVTRLKKEAIDQRVTLSELIRSRLK
jgi:hypothetical protein